MICTLVPLTILGALITAQKPAKGSYEFSSYAFSKQYTVKVTGDALNGSPSWQDNAMNPPLQAGEAIKLANSLRDSLIKDKDRHTWQLTSASLIPFGDRWFWMISFAIMKRGSSEDAEHTLRLGILMDGTVIKPVVTNSALNPEWRIAAISVPSDAVKKAHAWAPEQGNPPLSARKAIQLANLQKESLSDYTTKIKWKLRSVSLKTIADAKWVWVVEYEKDGINIGRRVTLRFAVMMDGTVIRQEA